MVTGQCLSSSVDLIPANQCGPFKCSVPLKQTKTNAMMKYDEVVIIKEDANRYTKHSKGYIEYFPFCI